MKDEAIFKAGILFMASLAKVSREARFPVDNRKFALAVDRAREDGNRYAKQFFVADLAVGRYCEEYNVMLSMMMHAGLISYLSPDYNQFILNITPRGAKTLIDRDDATSDEVADAEAFVTQYFLRDETWTAAI